MHLWCQTLFFLYNYKPGLPGTFKNFKYEALGVEQQITKIQLKICGQRSLNVTWNKLNRMAQALAAWSRNSFRAPRKEIRKEADVAQIP
jgi:hypothetical protein